MILLKQLIIVIIYSKNKRESFKGYNKKSNSKNKMGNVKLKINNKTSK